MNSHQTTKELRQMPPNPDNQPQQDQWEDLDLNLYGDWILEWLPHLQSTSVRFIEATNYERIATANATPAFTNAITQLIDQIAASDSSNSDKTTRITASGAILYNFMSSVAQRVDVDEVALINDRDVPEHETAEARIHMAFSVDAANNLASHALNALQEADIPLTPRQMDWKLPEAHDTNQQAAAQRKLYHQAAETAFMTGNAAALQWHLDEIEKIGYEEEPMGPISGQILAMWPAENNLMKMRYREHEDDKLHQAAGKAREDAIGRLLTAEYTNMIEFARPVHVSTNLDEDNPPDFLIGQSWGRGPECEAMYDSIYDDPNDILMLYRYQGCTHVKMANEPYSHPIDMETALSHCNELEKLISELEDLKESSRLAAYQLAITNRAKVLAGLHYTPEYTVYQTLKKTKRAIPEQTRQKALVNAICDGFREPAEEIYRYHDLNESALTPEQLQVAISATRTAGASEATLRDMATMLGIPSDVMEQFGITSQQPVPWVHAHGIIEDIYLMKPSDSPSWLYAAEAMGWPIGSEEVINFADYTGETDQLMLYLTRHKAENTDD